MKQIWNFVITGGPCSGKTTALATIEQELTNRGYYVLIVPETATELIPNGIRPYGNSLDILQFQYIVFDKQLYKENLYRKIAKLIPSDKIVIIHDRGIMDNKSYISNGDFKNLLNDFSMNEVEARDRYDAVFHLVTAANGAEDFYTLENNTARTETPEEARKLDSRGIANWTGHNHFYIIDNSTDFDSKIKRLMHKIYYTLGDPVPTQIERKYLIKYPNLKKLKANTTFTTVNIVQSYLKSEKGIERRIQQRGQNGNFTYYYTEKREIDYLQRIRIERKISEKEYLNYLSELDPMLKPIVKNRICCVYFNQYFKIDLFEISDKHALAEIELTDTKADVVLPPFVEIIKEVTDNDHYRNSIIARLYSL